MKKGIFENGSSDKTLCNDLTGVRGGGKGIAKRKKNIG